MLALLKKLFTNSSPRTREVPRRRPRPPRPTGTTNNYIRRDIEEIREMLETARREQNQVRQELEGSTLAEHIRRAQAQEQRTQEDMAQMRFVHRPTNVMYEDPSEVPAELSFEDIVHGGGHQMPMSEVVKALALEIMTLRDEIATLEERLETAEYYNSEEAA